jgi:hypothetical protein
MLIYYHLYPEKQREGKHIINQSPGMSEITAPNPLSFSLFFAQRLVDRAFSPIIYLTFPIIRLRFPMSFVTVVAIEFVIPLIFKWSAIREDRYNFLIGGINQVYPDYEALRQILNMMPSSQVSQNGQRSQPNAILQSQPQSQSQAQTQPALGQPQAPGQSQSQELPFLTTVLDPPRPPGLDTPPFPRFLSLVFQLSATVINPKLSALFDVELAESELYPRFFLALVTLLLYFALTIKEKREQAQG